MKLLVIFIEGGGKPFNKLLAIELRAAFSSFLTPVYNQLENVNWRLAIEVCGGRSQAWSRFSKWRTDLRRPDAAVLLVDSETPVEVGENTPMREQAKRHLMKLETGWSIQDYHYARIHLMVTTMESWFLADVDALHQYFGRGVNSSSLNGCGVIEKIPKEKVVRVLSEFSRRSKKQEYHKGRHQADLLKLIDASKVQAACPHCKRLFEELPQIDALT